MKFNVGTTIYLVIFTVLLIEKIQENSALHLKGTFKTNELKFEQVCQSKMGHPKHNK